MGDTLVLDLETQKTFDEVGGRENLHRLRVSVAGIYSYEQDLFQTFTEWETPALGELLMSARLIVGFNIKRFDFPVLEPYLKRSLRHLPALDIMEEVEKHLGHRLSLEALVRATLGEGKTGSGLDAIRYFRNGEMEKLKSYCLSDVRLTRNLYEYGKRHGCLRYQRNQDYYSIPVNWGSAKAIPS
jgi:DEAD/DEAH box helicase domain-containing protein